MQPQRMGVPRGAGALGGVTRGLPSLSTPPRSARQRRIISAAALRGGAAGPRQPTSSADVRIAVEPSALPAPTPVLPASPWASVAIVAGLTVTSVASMVTAFILYARPALRAAQEAALTTDQAAKDMQQTAAELEKTALMFQQDIPLTMKDIQQAAEEWEILGKQMNFVVASITRPLSPKPAAKPGGAAAGAGASAADWVGAAGASTASLSKRVASDTSNLATTLWSTVNQFRQQLGWSGLSKEAAEEAKRLVYIGRQQQEARSWIAAWRSRTGGIMAGPSARAIAALQAQQDEADRATVAAIGERVREAVVGAEEGAGVPEQSREAVEAVLAALERAQRAAEEAAASSSALERAIEEAEAQGALSSSDEEDFTPLELEDDRDSGSSENGKSNRPPS